VLALPGGCSVWLLVAWNRLLRTLEGHTAPVSGVAFSRNGSALTSGPADGTVRLWGPLYARQRTHVRSK
jgi:WD40 repeat protein